MVKKQFIDKRSARVYQLVHRSQRDPALASEETSKYVLKPIPPSMNLVKKGLYKPNGEIEGAEDEYYKAQKYLQDDQFYTDNYDALDEEDLDDFDIEELEEDDDEYDEDDDEEEKEEEDAPPKESLQKAFKKKLKISTDEPEKPMKTLREYMSEKEKFGEATKYGIFFNDQNDYDYTQHLKIIGEDPSAVFVGTGNDDKKAKSGGDIMLKEESSGKKKVSFALPQEVLPSATEEAIGLMNKQSDTVMDFDPKVREVFYALEDEAYIQNDLDDDFFSALNAEELPEQYVEEVTRAEQEWKQWAGEDSGRYGSDDEYDYDSTSDQFSYTGSDTATHRAPNKWDRMTNFSMTSSAMFRNKHLTLLDDRFDQILAEYSDEEIGELDEYNPEVRGHVGEEDEESMNPHLEKVLDEFLDTQEVVGKRVYDKSGMIYGADGFSAMRNELRESVRKSDLERAEEFAAKSDNEEGITERELLEWAGHTIEDKERDRWDCETILTTYSNIYNHPSIIGEGGKQARQIRLHPVTGMPMSYLEEKRLERQQRLLNRTRNFDANGDEMSESDDENDSNNGMSEKLNKGTARSKGETKEEKKARKEAVKAEKKSRREEKKNVKALFKEERKKQKKNQPSAILHHID